MTPTYIYPYIIYDYMVLLLYIIIFIFLDLKRIGMICYKYCKFSLVLNISKHTFYKHHKK